MKQLIALLSLLIFFNFGAIAQDNPQAMIVFDASGSMWGQINGKAKITIAKKALNNVVSDWDKNVHLGLIAYGHRKKGDCNDIQTLVPIGEINKDAMISIVKQIKPKGKTPISRSIKKAAEALRYTEEKATVILISDGKETCNADPCGTAKSLESEGIDFVAHVIGFNVDKQTDAQLKCIADVTGGAYFSAKNSSSLNDAMKQIVKKVQVEEAKPEPKPETKPEPPVVKKLKNNLEITASESDGSKWVEASHYIYPIINGEKQDYIKRCSSKKKEACLRLLPEGKYSIESTYNEFKQETTIELKSSELTKVHIIMGQTGKVEISASESEGSKWIEASHYIYPVVDGEKQDYIKRCNSKKKEACLKQIPVGKYSIESTYNEFKQASNIEIKSGVLTKVHVVMGQTGKVEISASESEGSKWIEANHYIYPVVDGEKQDYIKRCNSYKKKTCIKQLPVGRYNIASTFNKFKQNTSFEIKSGEAIKVHIIMGQTGKIELSASESEGSKWIKAYHRFYAIIDGEKQDERLDYCYSEKKKACLQQLPAGKYIVHSTFNKLKQDTTVEFKSGEVTKVHIIMGKTGKIELSASESEGSKWIKAYHRFYAIIDGEKQDERLDYCYSEKQKACLQQLPAGKYSVLSTFNKFKQDTTVEFKSGEVTKVHIIMGQTGKVELSASESEGSKWIKAYHRFYTIIDGEKQEKRLDYCYSEKQKSCIKQLPAGKYSVLSTFNKFKQDTNLEIKSGEVTKINIIMGQTGKIELSASEAEGGKWVKAYHRFYPIIDGEKQDERLDYCYSNKKEACIKQLPLGKYNIHSTYKKFKRDTILELKAGDKKQINISFAPFHLSVEGISQCSEILHEVISSTGRTVTEAKATAKNGANFVLPAGKYTIESTIDNITQKTKIVIGGDMPTKDAVVHFGGEDTSNTIAGLWKTSQRNMTLQLKGTTVTGTYENENGTINGEMTYPQRFEGYWTETKSNHKCQESKQGSNYWGKTTWEFNKDMCSFKGKWGYCDKKQDNSWTGSYLKALPVPAAKQRSPSEKQTEETPPEDTLVKNQVKKVAETNTETTTENTSNDDSSKEEDKTDSKAEKEKPKARVKPIQAFKKSVVATLPIIKESKSCYEKANNLEQVKPCEALEKSALTKAQQIMDKELGTTTTAQSSNKHSEWNDSIKKITLDNTTDDIKKMELSILCIDKGTDFSELKSCIDNGAQ